jgi:hypothetical protein
MEVAEVAQEFQCSQQREREKTREKRGKVENEARYLDAMEYGVQPAQPAYLAMYRPCR